MSRRTVFQQLLSFVAILAILLVPGGAFAQGRRDAAFERVREVQERHTNRLLAMPGVEGTAVGYNPSNEMAVQVFTDGPSVAGIPKTLDGIPVHVEVTGKFYALPKGAKPDKKPPKDKIDPTGWFSAPVPIGVSTGNEGECSAGTIGCRVTDGTAVYALSNNHVYALENKAPIGSGVLQPGLYDTNCEFDPTTEIGTLSAFEPISFTPGTSNSIDAAIAASSPALLGNATPADGYGLPRSETVDAVLNMAVRKYGRTTGQTTGTITGLNASLSVVYTSGTAHFVGQIVITADRGKFSSAGDSGSLVVTEGRNPVGLLFAGSARQTVANPIDLVLSRFDVTIDGE